MVLLVKMRRIKLDLELPGSRSHWKTHQLWMANQWDSQLKLLENQNPKLHGGLRGKCCRTLRTINILKEEKPIAFTCQKPSQKMKGNICVKQSTTEAHLLAPVFSPLKVRVSILICLILKYSSCIFPTKKISLSVFLLTLLFSSWWLLIFYSSWNLFSPQNFLTASSLSLMGPTKDSKNMHWFVTPASDKNNLQIVWVSRFLAQYKN